MAKAKTYDTIKDCASRMFALHGYNGTIMDDLAEQCKVNKASIYYHHKDKATLYENCLTALFTPIADAVIDAVGTEETPVKKLEVHIKTFAEASSKTPEFASILMREMASGGLSMPMSARKQMQRILFLLTEILQQGQDNKIFRQADPLMIHFMIIGTINLFVASIPFRKNIPATEQCKQLNNTDVKSAAEQVAQTIINSLLTTPTQKENS